MPSATLKTVTLGCKVNQYETEFVRQALVAAGYRDAGEHAMADVCIVNTCTVTNEGDAKSRQVIRRLARRNPEARIIVMGCYATRAPDEVARLPGVVEVVTDKRELPDLLGRFGVIDVPAGISTFGDRHRAYVKVQDGCLLRCSYCVIPHVRPKMHSRPTADILEEVQRLVNNGYREVVLTGIHLGHYGVDWNWNRPKHSWTRLSTLLKAVAKLDGEFRVRLSSIEATEVTRELLEVMADHRSRICPHLHVCLQSGSDSVLRRMRRRWGTRRFIDRCRMIRKYLDMPALTTDIIVGFPGETDAEFEQTCDVTREIGFSKIHIFPFSARRGTPASTMPDQVPAAVKASRCQQLSKIEIDLRLRYFESLLGKNLQMLVESQSHSSGGQVIGTSCRYVPIELGSRARAGDLIQVTPISASSDRLLAVLGARANASLPSFP
jgi:threonylcarbamoyladenosine tRNA methylthiotransferase MtaB